MKKIIAALDGLRFSRSTTDYAISLASQTGAHLVGIFLDDVTYHSYKIFELVHDEGVYEEEIEVLESGDEATRHQASCAFENACIQAGISYSIHHDRNLAIRELLHESLFADLMVIDARETLTHYQENQPTRFIRSLLARVECPVLVVPPRYTIPEKAILLYDGEPSSIYAIKMFSYLFPQFGKIRVEVISVAAPGESSREPEKFLMKEFLKSHFEDVRFTCLKGLPDTGIAGYLTGKVHGEWIVMGAYGRGTVSRWIRPSLADSLMQQLPTPLFIAHK
jgi:nucleotide-binding universal stress UspA family protein